MSTPQVEGRKNSEGIKKKSEASACGHGVAGVQIGEEVGAHWEERW